MANRIVVFMRAGLALLLASSVSTACEDLPDPVASVQEGPSKATMPVRTTLQQAQLAGFAKAKRPDRPVSGKVNILLDDYLAGLRTQAITFPSAGAGATAKQVEIRVYQAGADPYPLATGYIPALSPLTGNPSIATSSITNGILPTLTCPAVYAGRIVVQINVYDTKATLYDVSTGVADPSAASHLIAQGEGYTEALAGQQVSVAIRVHRAASLAQHLHSSTNQNLLTYLIPSAGSGYLYYRLIGWNPYTELTPVTGSQYRLRLMLMARTAFASQVASASSTQGWGLGDLGSAQGYSATRSFCVPDGAESASPWQFVDSARKYMYCDIDLTDSVPLGLANYVGNGGQPTLGSLSVTLPIAIAPSATTLYISDLGVPTSIATAVRI